MRLSDGLIVLSCGILIILGDEWREGRRGRERERGGRVKRNRIGRKEAKNKDKIKFVWWRKMEGKVLEAERKLCECIERKKREIYQRREREGCNKGASLPFLSVLSSVPSAISFRYFPRLSSLLHPASNPPSLSTSLPPSINSLHPSLPSFSSSPNTSASRQPILRSINYRTGVRLEGNIFVRRWLNCP